MDDLDELYGDQTAAEPSRQSAISRPIEQDHSMSSSSDSDDSEIEFVIKAQPGVKVETALTNSTPPVSKSHKPKLDISSDKVKPQPVAKLPDVEVDAIAELDGKSILEVDLETLHAKPWRQAGADITEYFNYGFDEFTWTAYCQKQSNLRQEYSPEKVMASMMNPMMGMGMRKRYC